MIPAKYNIEVYEGRDYAVVFTFDYTITGMTFTASYESGSTKNNFTVTDLNTTQIKLSLTSTQITALTNKIWKWDLKQVSNGFASQVIEGNLKRNDTVTV
jgi:hypothetical protein